MSWGILYYAFPVLLPAMERDLGWSRTTLIGAYTVAVIVSGLAALPVGRLLDHRPARPLMTAGSILATVAVLGWAAANTVGAFYVVWIAIGAAMALVLYEPAQVVLVKQFGAHATRAITTLTLVAGFASTIFQPAHRDPRRPPRLADGARRARRRPRRGHDPDPPRRAARAGHTDRRPRPVTATRHGHERDTTGPSRC